MMAAKLLLPITHYQGVSVKNEKQPHAPLTCGAKTRCGEPCKLPPVKGKMRCRMHGGANGSGAPKGNQNALKHGYYSANNKIFKSLIQTQHIIFK